MENEKVSILIPVYNREQLISDTINSAMNQTYKNTEIIIIDNKSTDKTYKIAKVFERKDARIKVFQNKENIGPVRNWEKCVKYASGDFVKILFSDDLMKREFVTESLKCLKNNDDVAFVCTGVKIITPRGKIISKNLYFDTTGKHTTKEFIRRVLLGGHVSVSASHALFRKKDLLNCFLLNMPNKINSDFSMHAIGSDALMFLLIANRYDYIYFIRKYLTNYKSHSDSITIKSDTSQLILLHLLARAYFVENFVHDLRLTKIFNSRILVNLAMYSKSSKLGLHKISDFYYRPITLRCDLFSFARYSFSALIKVIYRIVKKTWGKIHVS